MTTVNAPEWVNKQLFTGLLKHNYNDFKTIQKFVCTAAISGGENYLTIVLRIEIGMQMKGGFVSDKYVCFYGEKETIWVF